MRRFSDFKTSSQYLMRFSSVDSQEVYAICPLIKTNTVWAAPTAPSMHTTHDISQFSVPSQVQHARTPIETMQFRSQPAARFKLRRRASSRTTPC